VSGSIELTGQGDVPVSHGRLRGEELRLMLPLGHVDAAGGTGRARDRRFLSGTVRRADREVAN